MIDCLVLYAVSAIFQLYYDGTSLKYEISQH